MKKAFPIPVRVKYSCAKCPAYCCSYPEIEATPRDIQHRARHFGLGYEEAEERFTRRWMSRGVASISHRQTTRLNSSHEWTSHAVFCLEKNTLRVRIPPV